MADAVACAKPGQTTPEGLYNIGRMLKGLTSRGVVVGAYGTCLDARGYSDANLADGIHRSSMAELAAWTLEAEWGGIEPGEDLASRRGGRATSGLAELRRIAISSAQRASSEARPKSRQARGASP